MAPRGIDSDGSPKTALHCTTPHCTALHYTSLHCTTLHYIALHCTTLHYTALHYTALHCTTLHYTTLHYTALHYTTLHYTALHYTTLHYTTLHYTIDSHTVTTATTSPECLAQALGCCEHHLCLMNHLLVPGRSYFSHMPNNVISIYSNRSAQSQHSGLCVHSPAA